MNEKNLPSGRAIAIEGRHILRTTPVYSTVICTQCFHFRRIFELGALRVYLPTGRAPTVAFFSYSLPTKHADLVPTLAREEPSILLIPCLTTYRAYFGVALNLLVGDVHQLLCNRGATGGRDHYDGGRAS
jgi:hypothetical protein